MLDQEQDSNVILSLLEMRKMARIQVSKRNNYNNCALNTKLVILSILVVIECCHAQQDRFFIRHPFKVLPQSQFIASFRAYREMECAFACNRRSHCKSFNFGSVKDSVGKYTCQLLSVDMISKPLVGSSVYHHFQSFRPDPCASSPCQNGGKCSVTKATGDVKCTCPLGFSGNLCQIVHWIKFNNNPKCFGASNNHFGPFTILNTGSLVTMRLVHLTDRLTCDTADPKGWNHWGCLDNAGKYRFMSVIITDNSNTVKLPSSDKLLTPLVHVWNSAGMDAKSKELVFPSLKTPLSVVSGQNYRIWFGQDLDNRDDSNNGGKVCVDVYGLYK